MHWRLRGVCQCQEYTTQAFAMLPTLPLDDLAATLPKTLFVTTTAKSLKPRLVPWAPLLYSLVTQNIHIQTLLGSVAEAGTDTQLCTESVWSGLATMPHGGTMLVMLARDATGQHDIDEGQVYIFVQSSLVSKFAHSNSTTKPLLYTRF